MVYKQRNQLSAKLLTVSGERVGASVSVSCRSLSAVSWCGASIPFVGFLRLAHVCHWSNESGRNMLLNSSNNTDILCTLACIGFSSCDVYIYAEVNEHFSPRKKIQRYKNNETFSTHRQVTSMTCVFCTSSSPTISVPLQCNCNLQPRRDWRGRN